MERTDTLSLKAGEKRHEWHSTGTDAACKKWGDLANLLAAQALRLGHRFHLALPQSCKMYPIMQYVERDLLIKRHIHCVSAIKVPVAQILAQRSPPLVPLTCCGRGVAQGRIVGNGTSTQMLT